VQRFLDQDPCEHSFNHARLNSDGAPDARSASTSKGFSGGGGGCAWLGRQAQRDAANGQGCRRKGASECEAGTGGRVRGDERSRYFVPARPNYEDLKKILAIVISRLLKARPNYEHLKKMLAIVISRLLKYLFQITKDPPPRKFKDMPSANSTHSRKELASGHGAGAFCFPGGGLGHRFSWGGV
jgi:hypothetical protein